MPSGQTEKRGQGYWRREVTLLALVLLGIAIFLAGYATGRHDDTFRTSWYSPLRGTSVAPQTVGSVQGQRIDPASGNTPLLVTVRGLRILPANEYYALYVLGKHGLSRCGEFTVGKGTTQVKLSYPGLPQKPRGWKIARERNGATAIGRIVAQTASR